MTLAALGEDEGADMRNVQKLRLCRTMRATQKPMDPAEPTASVLFAFVIPWTCPTRHWHAGGLALCTPHRAALEAQT